MTIFPKQVHVKILENLYVKNHFGA